MRRDRVDADKRDVLADDQRLQLGDVIGEAPGALSPDLLGVSTDRPQPWLDDAGRDAYVFATSTGGRMSASNIRNRVLTPAMELATEALVSCGAPPLPHLTPHSCRRTFASVLYALEENPKVIMAEMGHTDEAFALQVYSQMMRRDEGENQRLAALAKDGILAVIGSPAQAPAVSTADLKVA